VIRTALLVALLAPVLALGGAHGTAPEQHHESVGQTLGSWRWPVDGARIVVRPYLAPPTAWAAGHRGVDLESTSTVVRAPADGVVHFVGFVVNRPVLSIEHSGGLLSSFEPVDSPLRAGDPVKAGDEIGRLETGHCAIVRCLHFGLRLSGEYVSPLLLLGGVPRAVLVPTRG
jgi:murein DD-endopeptidase MepM/ murein hydrolase activator NlpD